MPKAPQEAAAQFLANGKARQVFLKRSLGTKDLRRANVLVKPVLVQLDRVISDAKAHGRWSIELLIEITKRTIHVNEIAAQVEFLNQCVYA